MKVYFVQALCQENPEGMKRQKIIQESLGARVIFVANLADVPKGYPYFDGTKIILKD